MRNNMTASMFDLSAAGKSRSRLGKFKDKVRGKKKESEASSVLVPTFGQVLTDSEEEGKGGLEEAAGRDEEEKKKKHKMKSLFAPKSNLQKNLSQSMTVLPGKNSSLTGSLSSLNVDTSEGKKKFKFLKHKRSDSRDSQKQMEQSNLCINGSHIYCEEPQPRSARTGSNFSLTSSGHGSMEDVPQSSPPSVDSLRVVKECPSWTEEQEEADASVDKMDCVSENRRLEEEECGGHDRLPEIQSKEEVEQRSDEDGSMGEVGHHKVLKMLKRFEEGKQEKREVSKIIEEKQRKDEKRVMESRAREEERIRKENEMADTEKRKQQHIEEEQRLKEEEEERLVVEKRRQEEEERRVMEDRMQREEFERVEQRRKEEQEKLEKKRILEEEEERKHQERIQKEKEVEIKKLHEEKQQREWERRQAKEERLQKEKEELLRRAMEEKLQKEEERKQVEEERIKREQEKLWEEERLREMEEKKRQEEKRQQEEKDRQEEERKLEEKKRQEEERKLEEKRQEEERKLEEKKRQEEERKLEEKRQEEERKLEEKKRQEEERKLEEKRQEEERKLEEKKRQEEERKLEEKKRQEEERKLDEKRRQEERKLEEEKRAQMEQARLMEEERGRKEEEENLKREMEEKRQKEERKRVEEARIQQEKEILMEEERIRKEEEKRKRQEKEEALRREEEQKVRAEQERKKLEEMKRAEEERIQKEQEESKRQEEQAKLKEQERMEREEQERRDEEERVRRERLLEEESRMMERRAEEEQKMREDQRSQLREYRIQDEEQKRQLDEETRERSEFPDDSSKNPLEENLSDNPSDEIPDSPAVSTVLPRCQSDSSDRSEAVLISDKDHSVSQWKKSPAPQPPGRNPAVRRRQQEWDESQAQMTMKHKDPKTVSVVPQQLAEAVPSLRLIPTQTKSDDVTGPSERVKHSKGPAPSRPSHRLLSAASKPGRSLNPFEEDDAEDTEIPHSAISIVHPDSEAKTKSSKVTRAPKPPTNPTMPSTSDPFADNLNLTPPRDSEKPMCDPERDSGLSLSFPEGSPHKSAPQQRVEESHKRAHPPTTPRRLQPVKPLNALEHQVHGQKVQSAPAVEEQNKQIKRSEVKGPYSLLTQDELVGLVQKQEQQLMDRDKKIAELEQYIDNLLVRVMEEQPSILMSMTSMKTVV
ncbi:golgin subfamily A member 6-like protein 25 isoform X2 [Synchiropus splendidus]|nr:golgin subfamily A member 6-like protein 25 isoform X2 [Synchiropus splendidus]XP_053716949.1 golgin subfamily A member 6-like protein 25 isoform X2 [Synchiropus splendidus]